MQFSVQRYAKVFIFERKGTKFFEMREEFSKFAPANLKKMRFDILSIGRFHGFSIMFKRKRC